MGSPSSPSTEKHKIGKWNNNSNASRFEGIGAEGLCRYEELYDKVLEARKDKSRIEHSKKYLKYGAKLYEALSEQPRPSANLEDPVH